MARSVHVPTGDGAHVRRRAGRACAPRAGPHAALRCGPYMYGPPPRHMCRGPAPKLGSRPADSLRHAHRLPVSCGRAPRQRDRDHDQPDQEGEDRHERDRPEQQHGHDEAEACQSRAEHPALSAVVSKGRPSSDTGTSSLPAGIGVSRQHTEHQIVFEPAQPMLRAAKAGDVRRRAANQRAHPTPLPACWRNDSGCS